MKKVLLTCFVVGCFALYSFHQRHGGSSVVIKAPATAATQSPTSSSGSTGTSTTPAASYKDGQYTGTAADAIYGFIQVEAVISGGKLTDVKFLQTPNDRDTSIMINSQATPYLKQEALQAQSANVSGVSGATDSSQAFIQSLSSALKQAQS
jgi:uncharacterized protein with FMN-binding domain